MDKKCKIGVGFMLFSNGGSVPRIFTVEELESKPEVKKKKGMISFPLETFKEKDICYHNTIIRLIKEEIGISVDQVSNIRLATEKFQLIPGRKDIYTVYGYGIFHGNMNGTFSPQDTDIRFSGWKTMEELLLLTVRLESAPIIEHFRKNHYQELLKQLS